MSTEKEIKRITTKALYLLKKKGVKITALTAYDFITAKLLDEAGIDIILVGDSLGNVFQGNDTTLPVTMDEMIYHTKAVTKGVHRAMVIVDMPFMSYQLSTDEGFRNAGRIMKRDVRRCSKARRRRKGGRNGKKNYPGGNTCYGTYRIRHRKVFISSVVIEKEAVINRRQQK